MRKEKKGVQKARWFFLAFFFTPQESDVLSIKEVHHVESTFTGDITV